MHLQKHRQDRLKCAKYCVEAWSSLFSNAGESVRATLSPLVRWQESKPFGGGVAPLWCFQHSEDDKTSTCPSNAPGQLDNSPKLDRNGNREAL
eukprot:2486849-Amphidinium_carterae.1